MLTTPLTVTEYITLLNSALSAIQGEIVGEISELKIPGSGHVYGTLKDKNTGDVMPFTIWKRDYAFCGIELEIGMEVLVKGSPRFYGPFGKFSFHSKTVELVGEGALKKAYEKLKKKLTAEGLFEQARKRPLPVFPRKIGVITSTHGAVIHDFSNNLRRSGFKVKILNCRVEGPESGRDLALSVRAFRDEDIDVLVLIRGGGSIQSLAGFDNEALVREIASFPVPVLAGIGHHQDIPLAALVADACESTPSLTAARLGLSWEQAGHLVDRSAQTIFANFSSALRSSNSLLSSTFEKAKNSFDEILNIYAKAKQAVQNGMYKIKMRLAQLADKINYDAKYIADSLGENFNSVNVRLDNLTKLIEANNPERQLRLGYSIIFNKDKVVSSVENVAPGDTLNLKVGDGTIFSEVKLTKKI